MKKFFMVGGTVAMAAAFMAAPSAQAAGSPYFPNGKESIQNWGVGLQLSEPVYWCENGKLEWAAALKVDGKPRAVDVYDHRSYAKDNIWKTGVIGNHWTVVRGHGGAPSGPPNADGPFWSGGADFSFTYDWTYRTVGILYMASPPQSCKGLPTAPPALGQAPGETTPPPTTKPTTPQTTKPTTPPTTTPTTPPTSKPTTPTTTTKSTKPGGTTTAPKPTSTATPTVKPTSTVPVPTGTATVKPTGTTKPTTHTGTGPQVQTDQVSGSNNGLVLELGVGAAAIATAGGAIVVARRRQG